MKTIAYHLKHFASSRLTFVVATSLHLPLILLTSSCSSICHRDQILDRTLATQAQLIKKLSAERDSEAVKSRLHKDATLTLAERHLSASLAGLLESIETVRTTFFDKQKGKANERHESAR